MALRKNAVLSELWPADYHCSGGGRNGDYFDRKKQREIDEKTKYIDIELEFTPKKGQRRIIELCNNRDLRKIVINIFRQYGKSFVCSYLALVWMQTPDTVVGYITQTSRLAKDIYPAGPVWPAFP